MVPSSQKITMVTRLGQIASISGSLPAACRALGPGLTPPRSSPDRSPTRERPDHLPAGGGLDPPTLLTSLQWPPHFHGPFLRDQQPGEAGAVALVSGHLLAQGGEAAAAFVAGAGQLPPPDPDRGVGSDAAAQAIGPASDPPAPGRHRDCVRIHPAGGNRRNYRRSSEMCPNGIERLPAGSGDGCCDCWFRRRWVSWQSDVHPQPAPAPPRGWPGRAVRILRREPQAVGERHGQCERTEGVIGAQGARPQRRGAWHLPGIRRSQHGPCGRSAQAKRPLHQLIWIRGPLAQRHRSGSCSDPVNPRPEQGVTNAIDGSDSSTPGLAAIASTAELGAQILTSPLPPASLTPRRREEVFRRQARFRDEMLRTTDLACLRQRSPKIVSPWNLAPPKKSQDLESKSCLLR